MKGAVRFKKGWVDEVEPGRPFQLVKSADDTPEPVSRARKSARASVSHRVRRLQEYGELMTVDEVAKLMKVTVDYVYKQIKSGRLRHVLIGSRTYRIAIRDLEEFLSA